MSEIKDNRNLVIISGKDGCLYTFNECDIEEISIYQIEYETADGIQKARHIISCNGSNLKNVLQSQQAT